MGAGDQRDGNTNRQGQCCSGQTEPRQSRHPMLERVAAGHDCLCITATLRSKDLQTGFKIELQLVVVLGIENPDVS